MADRPDCRIGIEDIPTAEILAEHYQKTYELTHAFWKERNRFFILLLLAAGLESLLLFQPTGVLAVLCNVYTGFLEGKADCVGGLDSFKRDFPFGLLQSVLLVVILYLMIQIYHHTVFINHMYTYLSNLEAQIRTAANIGDATFTREGNFYTQNEEPLQKSVGLVYGLLLGALLSLVIVGRLKVLVERPTNEFGVGTISLTLMDVLVLAVTVVFYWEYFHPAAAKYKDAALDSCINKALLKWRRRDDFRSILLAIVGTGLLFSLILLGWHYMLEYHTTALRFDIKRLPGAALRIAFYLILFVGFAGGLLVALEIGGYELIPKKKQRPAEPAEAQPPSTSSTTTSGTA